jgi:hypothetical protein
MTMWVGARWFFALESQSILELVIWTLCPRALESAADADNGKSAPSPPPGRARRPQISLRC